MSWSEIIKQEKEKNYFVKLTNLVLEDAKTYKIYPPSKDVFNAFKYTAMENIKVVIVGMDPYINSGQAHGLSFSVPEKETIPPSLNNIFKELQNDLNVTLKTGCLINWARQGVLLLNSVLTVREGQSGSHKDYGWEIFTDTIIFKINNINRPIAFLLWGAYAKSKRKLLNNPNHLILEGAHPSPLSANRGGFFGRKYFSKCNNFLVQHQIQPVDWSL